MFERKIFKSLVSRLQEHRGLIQVLSGPRQVGKTTLVHQALSKLDLTSHYVSADASAIKDAVWIEQQWNIARQYARQNGKAILVLDEIQKITNWSEIVKKLWDEDTRFELQLKVMLLGSAPVLMQSGLTESLAGRFETMRVTHWSYAEMHEAFGFNLAEYIYFGGYPGAAKLIKDETRWKHYIQDALIDTTINRDILMLTRVDKPILLKKLFELGCIYSGQILSLQKILGQLQDRGNTTTLAHYLDLLTQSGLLTGLQKFSGNAISVRSSSPKLQALDTGLISAQHSDSFAVLQQDRERWGRLLESAVATHLLNSTVGTRVKVQYWRQGDDEVDFVLSNSNKVVALEVKSGLRKSSTMGMKKFMGLHSPDKILLIGGDGMGLEEFFGLDVQELMR